MDKTFEGVAIKKHISAISSKSEAHRALICAAFSDKPTNIACTDTNADIDATASCLRALGANIIRNEKGFIVDPIKEAAKNASLDCNESGSTLRFLLPICAAIGADCELIMKGRLPNRPLSPLYELLSDNGVSLSEQGKSPLKLSGRLGCGRYKIAANVSSQYISGLLFALSLCKGESSLALEGSIESAPYIDMTLDTLLAFGAKISYDEETQTYFISGRESFSSPGEITVGGDWSNAAFFLCGGAVNCQPVTITGLTDETRQGDCAILSILHSMGAMLMWYGEHIAVLPSRLHGIDIDASQIPDLVPIIATIASVASGRTRIFNASRLRLKESDRIESVCSFLSALGADITATEDGMIIEGKQRLRGGTVDSFNDHRIAMSASIASLVCETGVTVKNFEAINKSYPAFAENFEKKDEI